MRELVRCATTNYQSIKCLFFRVAQSLFGKDHIIHGVSVHIGSAQPKSKTHDRGIERGRGYEGGGGGYQAFTYQQPNPWAAANQGGGGGGGGYNRGNRSFY